MSKSRYELLVDRATNPEDVKNAKADLNEGARAGNLELVLTAVTDLNMMGEARRPKILAGLGILGKGKDWKDAVDAGIWKAKIANDPGKVQDLVRMADLMGMTKTPLLIKILRIFDKTIPDAHYHFQEHFDWAKQEIEARGV